MSPKSNEEIWEDRAERYGSSFTRHPGRWILGVIIVIVLVGVVVGFIGNWFNADKEVFEPANVKSQYHFVISDYKAMEQQAEIVCEAEARTQAGTSREGPTFLEDPVQALASKYRQSETDYNTRQNNFFESKEVGPKGYPSTAPTLTEMEQKVCAP